MVALLVVLVDQLPVRGDLVAVSSPDDQPLGRPWRQVVPQVPELVLEGDAIRVATSERPTGAFDLT